MSSSTDKAAKKQKKNQKDDDGDVVPTLTKEETAIAKFLRLNCPNKPGTFVGMKVNFFIGNKLVDCLMESKWGPGKEKDVVAVKSTAKDSKSPQPLFATRHACVSFMQRLMNKQLFIRAVKVYKETTSVKETNKESKDDEKSTPDVRKRVKNSTADSSTTPDSPSKTESETPVTNTPHQKETAANKKKFKLENHQDQKFVDTSDPYVWTYDPTSMTTYIIGLLLILGSIGICLFPLWPSQVREGVYYLSLTGATFLGAILAVALIKYILFGLVWACTFGKIRFWLFPNLTEDVGFFESFVPVYKCNLCGDGKKTKVKEEATIASSTAAASVTSSDDADDNKTALTTSSSSNTPASSKAGKKSGTVASKGVVSNELSQSTLMINSISSDSPLLRSKTNSKDNGDEEFELLDDNEDELKKESSSDD